METVWLTWKKGSGPWRKGIGSEETILRSLLQGKATFPTGSGARARKRTAEGASETGRASEKALRARWGRRGLGGRNRSITTYAARSSHRERIEPRRRRTRQSSFPFHHLHKLVSIGGLVDSKPGHDPESAQRWKNGRSVLAENVKAVLPLFWQFHGFPLLLMVVGWWCFFFWLVGWFLFFCFFFHISLV